VVKKNLFFLAAAFLAFSCAKGNTGKDNTILLDQAIQKASDETEKSVSGGQIIALLNFYSPSEQFSEYVLEEMSGHLVQGRKLVVVSRSDLDVIRQEEHFQMSGEVSDESAQAIGKKLGAQLVVSGSLTDTGSEYRFRIKVLNVESAVIEVSSTSDIDPDETKVSHLLGNSGRQRTPAVAAAAAASRASSTAASERARPSAAQYTPPEMVRINGGTFIMGSPESEPDRSNDENQHQVTVSSLYMGKHQITVGQFLRFAEDAKYQTDAERFGGGTVWVETRWAVRPDANWKNPGFDQEDNHPVVLVSWYDAAHYCNWLSRQDGLTPVYSITARDVVWTREANGYRLPTEAEWEYACRAGTTTRYWSGQDEKSLFGKVNMLDRSAEKVYPYAEWDITRDYDDGYAHTSPVGSFQANPWGLFDIIGNVGEWCWDLWYVYYETGVQTDPTGHTGHRFRGGSNEAVIRGGGWTSGFRYLRSAYRYASNPSMPHNYVGFRVARNAN
jgi:formylglycine-generating enzyme required for sulfatase activity